MKSHIWGHKAEKLQNNWQNITGDANSSTNCTSNQSHVRNSNLLEGMLMMGGKEEEEEAMPQELSVFDRADADDVNGLDDQDDEDDPLAALMDEYEDSHCSNG